MANITIYERHFLHFYSCHDTTCADESNALKHTQIYREMNKTMAIGRITKLPKNEKKYS